MVFKKNPSQKTNKSVFDLSVSFKKEHNIKSINRKTNSPSFIVYDNVFLELIKKIEVYNKTFLKLFLKKV